jgi:pyridoxamine 5'-phosphate oxidase
MRLMETLQPSKLYDDYVHKPLTEKQAGKDPLSLFGKWFRQALKAGVPMPHAMTLATGPRPHARMVLLKEFTKKGFVFFTHYDSPKGRELASRPRASLVFYWPKMQRQVRIEGRVRKTPRAQSRRYFHSRPREYQIAALVSWKQSAVIPERKWLEERFLELRNAYEGKKIPHPPSWGGYVVEPETLEFWQGRPSRLHDRLRFSKKKGRWKCERLTP